MKTLMMTTAAALIAAGSAYAADVLVIVDGESMTMEQYRSTLAEPNDAYWFDAWDADRDGMLSRDEVNDAWFAQYDIDQDSLLSQDEVKAWNEDNLRLNAARSGREISPPGPAGGGETQ